MELNCDMGEAFGIYSFGADEALMEHVGLANVACGFHGGDPVVLQETVRLAKQHGVRVGAHPSYPDREGFGRRAIEMGREELAACLIYQIGALRGFLDAEGMELSHVKPHGALYGRAARDRAVADAVADAASVFGVPDVRDGGHPARGGLHVDAGSSSWPSTTPTWTTTTTAG